MINQSQEFKRVRLQEDMQALFERLQNIDNRNVRRQNKKLLNELLACLQLRVSTVVTLNVAELFYNGAPGIPTNLTMTLEYYVRAWESLIHDDITSSSSLHRRLFCRRLVVISSVPRGRIAFALSATS